MRSDLVAVQPPSGDSLTGLLQRLKPVLIETFIPERAVETLDIRVLGRAARLDQDMLDAVLLRPCHKCPACELWPVVSPDRLGVTPKCGCSVPQAGDVVTTNAKVSCDVHTFAREVVCHRQALDSPGDDARLTNGITDKVHASQVWLTAKAATSGTRTPMRLVFLRFLMDRPSAV